MKAHVIHPADNPAADEYPRKYGIWYTGQMQAAIWQLAPGQRIVAHSHAKADSLITVLGGTCEYFVYDKAEPDPNVCYLPQPESVPITPPHGAVGEPSTTTVGPGSIAVTPAGLFYGLANTSPDMAVALLVTAPDPSDTVYTVRPPLPVDNADQ